MSKRTLDEECVCSFFLERKKRYCRMKTLEGMTFCPHHSHLSDEKNEKKGLRVPCPYDSAHFCYESKLQKHLKICNAREKEKPEYFVLNVNACDDVDETINKKVTLSEISDETLLLVIKKVKTLYNESNIATIENTVMHPLLISEMERLDDGANTFKHVKQQASLLAIMEKYKFFDNGSCFIEFGAGKGQLMYWIIQCVPDNHESSFLLIDKSAQRHKSDNKYKGSDLEVQRIRIDIQHLHLGKIQSIKTKLNKVVGVSKHLCGAATDLALKCLLHTLESEENENKCHYKPFGLVMALCCHHRCCWNSYVGRNFIESKGLSETDFKIMCSMASWATCGCKIGSKRSDDDNSTDLHDSTFQDDKFLKRYTRLNLAHEERERIGMQCKKLIDAGRIHYLESQGYNVKLITYIEKSVSLENIALVASYKDN